MSTGAIASRSSQAPYYSMCSVLIQRRKLFMVTLCLLLLLVLVTVARYDERSRFANLPDSSMALQQRLQQLSSLLPNSNLFESTQNDVMRSDPFDSSVIERKTDDKLTSEGNPCLMERPMPVPTLWVLVPGGNGASFVSTTIESIHRQEIPVRALYVDDSSADGSSEIIRANLRPGDEFIVTEEHCGPACTKYTGFYHLHKKNLAKANDVVAILDADDYFMTAQASKRILEEYTSAASWITYGSFEGKWSEQVRAIKRDEFKDVRHATWVYGHPRSFRVGLTKFLCIEDFKDKNGTFFVKASERGFMYRWLELAGFDRTKYIEDKLVHYRWRTDNTVLSIPYKVKKALLDYIYALEPSAPLSEIHVVVFVQSPDTLRSTLSQLSKQSVIEQMVIHVCIPSTVTVPNLDANDPGRIEFTKLEHGQHTGFGLQKLKFAKDLMEKELVDYMIFLDDTVQLSSSIEQTYSNDYIERLWAARKPRTHLGWFTKLFQPGGSFLTHSTPTWKDLVEVGGLFSRQMHYIALGGSVIDAGIFQDVDLLRCPVQYEGNPDLWLAYLVQSHGWSKWRTKVKPGLVDSAGMPSLMKSDEFQQALDNTNTFLEYLQQRGFGCHIAD